MYVHVRIRVTEKKKIRQMKSSVKTKKIKKASLTPNSTALENNNVFSRSIGLTNLANLFGYCFFFLYLIFLFSWVGIEI